METLPENIKTLQHFLLQGYVSECVHFQYIHHQALAYPSPPLMHVFNRRHAIISGSRSGLHFCK